MTTCPGCGSPIDASDKFCRECGAATGAGSDLEITLVGDTLRVARCPVCAEAHVYPAVVTQSLNVRHVGGMGTASPLYETRALGWSAHGRRGPFTRPMPSAGGVPGSRVLPCLTTGKPYKIPWPPR